MNLSEKAYLSIITTVFSAIAVIFWFCIIPGRLLERDLAIGFFTSDIFMILTIVFLSWLINVREKAEWYSVKHLVLTRMENTINDLARRITEKMDEMHGLLDFFTASSCHDDETLLTYLRLDKASNLSPEDGKKIFFAKIFEGDIFLTTSVSKSLRIVMRECMQRISWIQDAYLKFLSPDIAFLLIEIQRHLEDFEEQMSDYDSGRIAYLTSSEEGEKIMKGVSVESEEKVRRVLESKPEDKIDKDVIVKLYIIPKIRNATDIMTKCKDLLPVTFHSLLVELCIIYGMINERAIRKYGEASSLMDNNLNNYDISNKKRQRKILERRRSWRYLLSRQIKENTP